LVHAIAEGSNDLAVELRHLVRVESRALLEAPSPHCQVEFHRGAEQDLLLAHQLRDPPLTEAPPHVELEEPVARLDESDRASQVDRIRSLDMRNSVVIEVDLDVGAETLQQKRFVPVHRMAGTDLIREDRTQGRDPEEDEDQEECGDDSSGCQPLHCLHFDLVSASRRRTGARFLVYLPFYQEWNISSILS
jgi:hypothetical protein